MNESRLIAARPLFVGDHVALDFVNTQYGAGAISSECFVDDISVMAWLRLAKVVSEDVPVAPEGLFELAVELRACAKLLLNAGNSDLEAALGVVNRVLDEGRPTRKLEWDTGRRSFTALSTRRSDAAGLLEPIAQALVEILTVVPPESVRCCEADDCTLLFYDSTKSRRRRWCSMAGCGNRMKVAAFRSRQKES
ncbi:MULTISPECIES: ABATE domain-containing protein [unclassified Acidovorax]|uniref:CGNR zinc finger domain-containing protein n=1 Tax=unclassified Acidovorax TaxID=2684926 RepID=UPI000C17FAED|nr:MULTISPECIES: ABATE domain-containing protein [unclassified Acidovorax]PIF16822.1 putative RNA-binding Zn ribbon-like protein [Acidovorax sp. 59]PKW04152.1 putative RNA-binding Zn ribbon-like protein [Acidovorax sp. 30]